MLLDALVRIGLNNPLAKSKLFEVLKFAKTNGMNEMLSYCYSFLGDFYTLGGNPVQGCIAYQKAAEIAEAIGFLADHKALSSKIFDCLRNQDKHQEANLALLKYIETNDSLHHIERNEILNRSIDRYEQKEIRKIELTWRKINVYSNSKTEGQILPYTVCYSALLRYF